MKVNRLSCIIAVLVTGVLLVSCASGPPLRQVPAENVSAEKARILVKRTTDFLYLALDARVSVNGEVVGALPRGKATFVDVMPGTVSMRVDHPSSPGGFSIQFQAKQGATYSVEVSPRNESFIPGAFLGVIGLAVDASVTENSGLFMVKLVAGEEAGSSTEQQQRSPSESVEEQLKRLKKMKDDGLIDADVYKEEQKRILSQ